MNNLIKQKEIEIIELKIKKLELDVGILKDVNNDEEEFKRIEGYDNYLVSNYGNVKNNKTNRIIKQNTHNGYRRICLCKKGKQKSFFIHRLVAKAFLENPDEKPMIDHIDNNPANNNVKNLRWCSQKDNLANQGKRINNKSGFKGVCFNKPLNKYQASININGKKKHLGLFETAEEASKAYDTKAKEIHGDFFYKNK